MASDSPRIWQARYDRLREDLRKLSVRFVKAGMYERSDVMNGALRVLEQSEWMPHNWDGDPLDSEDE